MTAKFTLQEVHALDEYINECIKENWEDKKDRRFWESIREKVWEHCK